MLMSNQISKSYEGSTLAVIDETSPMVGGGICYVVTSAVIFKPEIVLKDLDRLFVESPARKRPFHWHKEGKDALARMVSLIERNEIVASSIYKSVSPKQQKYARIDLIKRQALNAEKNGVTHLIIETSDATTNKLDKEAIDECFENQAIPYLCEHRPKTEKTLWIADAFCGIIKEYLTNESTRVYIKLEKAGILNLEFVP